MKLNGIHHITAITGNAQANVDFYTRVLGLRMVKKSVNQDARTFGHEAPRDCLADAGRRASDDDDLVRESHLAAHPRRAAYNVSNGIARPLPAAAGRQAPVAWVSSRVGHVYLVATE